MKLQFNDSLPHQKAAIESTLALFDGLAKANLRQTEYSLANALDLNPDVLLANLQQQQEQNLIEKSATLWQSDDMYAFPNFSIEMETGTGKTYVYLRTLFELHKQFKLSKFVIVVPSVAIREGVLSSLKIMHDHFRTLYNKIPYNYYVYNSKDLSKVRQFASAKDLQIMVINIQAFQRDAGSDVDQNKLSNDELKKLSVIHRHQDRMGNARPIELIQQARPVVIIDEPQSVDNTPKAKRAINNLKPLLALRYSATHKTPYNLIYQLGPVQAFEQHLVKQIAVASITADTNINETWVKLIDIGYKGKAKTPTAKVAIFEDTPNGTREKAVALKQGTDLSDHTNRAGYQGYIVDEIYAEPGAEYVTLTNGTTLEPEQEQGGQQEQILQRQIRETVEEHFRKERALAKMGVPAKVLSLFFIDRVANYRYYDDNGERQNGKLAQWFEAAYREVAQRPLFKDLPQRPVEQVHNGYFAEVKKKGKVVDYKETSGKTEADGEVYELIMRDKERLLDDAEPLRFIFSHSALKEGWDNPNVFQICTLREMGSEKERRQTLGRGLRLAVDSSGQRLQDQAINRLTVIASETFEQYAKELQTEMEKDIGGGFKFGRVPAIAFATLPQNPADSDSPRLGQEQSRQLWQSLKANQYLDTKGDLTTKFQPDDLHFRLELPEPYQPLESDIIERMRKFMFTGHIKNHRDRRPQEYNKRVELNPDFQALWEKISQKTRYQLAFDQQDLVDLAVYKLGQMPAIKPVAVNVSQTLTKVTDAGIGVDKTLQASKAHYLTEQRQLPDLLAELQQRTELTRASLFEMIKRCGRLQEFKDNPQGFITEAAQQIHKALDELVVDGIRYEKIQGEFYRMEEFAALQGKDLFLDRAYQVRQPEANETVKTPYSYVEFDSDVEHKTAYALDADERVRFFCKLPPWFKIPTPVGNYNPDWALVMEDDEKVYLIRETKSTHDADKRRRDENLKIQCGKAHFKILDEVDYRVATSITEVLDCS